MCTLFFFFLQNSGSTIATTVYPSLVTVKFSVPYMVSGVTSSSYVGVGVVIDAAKGLVICDRNTIPITLGDVKLCVAGSIHINATIVFLHPIHNFAVVQYDPLLLGKIVGCGWVCGWVCVIAVLLIIHASFFFFSQLQPQAQRPSNRPSFPPTNYNPAIPRISWVFQVETRCCRNVVV
jgi:hypothetical protein